MGREGEGRGVEGQYMLIWIEAARLVDRSVG